MPEWANITIVSVVIATGGYVVKTLVQISGTLGKIDDHMKGTDRRLERLERNDDDRNRSVRERGHL